MLLNSKSKECIIKAFAMSDIENPNIDFVIETLFYAYAKDKKTKLIDLPINLYSINKKLYSGYSKYLKKLISI